MLKNNRKKIIIYNICQYDEKQKEYFFFYEKEC